jgi:hypothetical protein
MANVTKKYSISSELAQKMVDEAVAKARELSVSENVAILDFIKGDPLAFSRHAHASAYGGVGRRVSHEGGRRNCWGDRTERGAHGAERHRLRESSRGARI